MKKIISALLCGIMLLCLAACKDEPHTETTTYPPVGEPTEAMTTTPEETVIQVELPDLPIAAVSLIPTTEAEVLTNGTVLFEYNYPTITLWLPDGEMAESVMLDFLNHVDSTRSAAQDILAVANEQYTGKPEWSTYFYNLTYSPMRIDTGVLSLYGMESAYDGRNHPTHNACAVNYDLTTGKAMKLRNILSAGVTADTLVRMVCDSLSNQADSLFSDYVFSVEDRFAGDFGADEQWYLSDTGLCFFFSPYEIAPYNSGTIIAEIPYDQLIGVLQDSFFPVETVSSHGTIVGSYFDDVPDHTMGRYSNFTEVTLHNEGTSLLLSTDEIAYHVKIETGEWNSDRTEFSPYSTVFAANVLTRSDAVILKVDKDSMPDLCISYTSMDEFRRCYPQDWDGVLTIVSESQVHGAAD